MNFKKFDVLDIGLIKWSSMSFALFVVSLWPAFSAWVQRTHWAWFLVVTLLLAIRPIISVFKK